MLLRWINVATLLLLLILSVPGFARSAGELEARLTALSAAGSGEAAYHLGMLYYVGLAGTPKDTRKAFELFKLAAERGDPLGAYKYGCYFDGQGEGIVESDRKMALRWKLVAAKAGYVRAQQDVTRHLFAEGDTPVALRWLEAAAAQGDMMALGALGSLYAGVIPAEMSPPKVPKDVGKGWAYLLLSAKGIPEMQDKSAGRVREGSNASAKSRAEAHVELACQADAAERRRRNYSSLPARRAASAERIGAPKRYSRTDRSPRRLQSVVAGVSFSAENRSSLPRRSAERSAPDQGPIARGLRRLPW